ncbi:SPOR domain-containing protein [Acidiphilium sp. PA]|uniref:septal ring lytic transglycosylase RlpA family protein n=1 Tax=Acidiphilium sp. PA TaxID=2871705 RepID=UPI002242F04C|nr:SPOR domain-containing protein [Acidiphilium sp. PA]MCW8308278.1 SPOR domain-containing protein [Acidiphilium sp. PA]
MNRAACLPLLAALALTGCVHKRIRTGPPPTGAHYLIGNPYQADGEWHYPRAVDTYDRTGLATVIPPGHDAATADGEAYDPEGLMAQSPILPLPSLVRVTNLVNGRTLTVRVNDRGPATAGRILAVSRKVASLLAFPPTGVVEVRVTLLAGRSAALQAALGAGPHLTAAPVAGVQSAALPPPPGAAGSAGPITPAAHTPVARLTRTAAATASPSGVVHTVPPDPGPLYVEIAGFGTGSDAQQTLDRLAGLPGSVVPQSREGRTLYAVELGPYHSVASADAALHQVLARGVPDPEITVH